MKRFIALIALLLLAGRAAALTIDVYHTSDAHGWYSARPAKWDAANSTRPIGGFAALSSYVQKDKNPHFLLDSGDLSQGTPEGILTKGMASVMLMNKLGYSAAVPGNHDYDYGEAALQVLVSSAAFPFLGANVYYKGTDGNAIYLKPYTIINKGGKKIAVLGLAGRHTATSTRPSNVRHLDFKDEAAEAAKWLPEIKAQNPDAVIVIAHLGISDKYSVKNIDISSWTINPEPSSTLAVARAAQGINLVLGGHNHAGFLHGYHDPVSGAWLSESGYGLSYVTRAALNFDDATGKLKDINVELVPLWVDQTGQNPAVQKIVDAYTAEADRKLGKTIGTLAGDLSYSADGLDSPIGNWFCDITREAAEAEVSLQNSKGLRTEIKKGEVRLRDIYQVMPFDNTLVTMTLTAAQIKQVMADNLRNGKSFMQISGLNVEFRQTVTGAEVHLKRDGREVPDTDEFSVVTNDYLAFGGDGGAAFAGGKDVRNTMIPVRDVMVNAFADGPVTPPATGRIQLK